MNFPPYRRGLLKRLVLLAMLAVIGANFVTSQTIHAHEVRPAYLQIQELDTPEPRYLVLWKQPIVQNGRLAIDPVFPSECVLEDQAAPEVTPNALIHNWFVNCDLSDAQIHISGLSVTLTDVMVRFTDHEGTARSYILRPQSPTLDLQQGSDSVLSYLLIGVEHLVFGIDHVLFVIGLVLFIRKPLMLIKTITAFTIAHSLTLALSVLGWVRLDQGPVEAVIALSILFLARELTQPVELRSRLTQGVPWAMAFIFGLLHGLGFAGALADIGLPPDSLWVSLLLFNVGIELGQLMVIAIILALGWALTRVGASLPQLTRYGAYGMGCMAAYWTIDRTVLLL